MILPFGTAGTRLRGVHVARRVRRPGPRRLVNEEEASRYSMSEDGFIEADSGAISVQPRVYPGLLFGAN